MKKLSYFLFLSIPLFTLWFCTSSSGVKEKDTVNTRQSEMKQKDESSVAVLELFTSQGCSSCPSADRLLDSYSHKENVIALSFHVDYWDRLGWKDPYSSHDYTQRQYKYASALNSSVYTPQLVINGESDMVGSDANKIEKTLKKVWSQNAKSSVAIQNVSMENGKVVINYTVTGSSPNYLLNIALIEKKTITPIRSGENGGVTLNGTNVVRNFKTVNKIDEGKNMNVIEIPSGADSKNLGIVLYLQKTDDNKILTAALHDIM